jgi:hypothetical protein
MNMDLATEIIAITGLMTWHALICLSTLFLIAVTGAAPDLNEITAAVLRWLGGYR